MLFKIVKEACKEENLFCFSPEVMLFTFISEIIMAIYIGIRYKLNGFNRSVIALLLCLSFFQIAEFQICGGSAQDIWLKIGFVSITLLPIIGLYMISEITGRKDFLKIGYILAILYVMYFTLVNNAIEGAVCAGNYMIFSGQQAIYSFYGFYYFGFLLLAIWEAWEGIKADKKKGKILWWMIAGYMSFMVPMGIIYIFSEQARQGVESIMCGFGIILALILTLRVVPLYNKLNKN